MGPKRDSAAGRRTFGEDLPDHESHGLIQFSRIQGSPGNLFGTPIKPHAFIRMTLSEGHAWHSTSDDRYHDGRIIAETWMSETQFAEMVTTMNIGTGVPCTLHRYRDGGKLKECEPCPPFGSAAKRTRQQFQDELEEAVEEMKEAEAALCKEVDESRLSVAKKGAIKEQIRRMVRLFTDSAPFVMERVEDHGQTVAQIAKAELTAYASNLAQLTGIETLKGQTLIEGADD